ncbi:hypothetical protein ABIE06_003379 [Pantoea dispersa]|uniref:conjugal transfer protein TraE n=1 Tax=Pantoea dispersa TaxID=59814 RepID=UPI003D258C44
MKRNNMTTILSRIALEQDEEMQQLVRQFADGKKTAGTPMAIRFRPAVREFISRVSQRLGISTAELVNVLMEGIMLETHAPRQATVTRIYERFWQLMDAHWLSVTGVATLLSGMNMGLSVLESRERTLDYLTASVIHQLAEWFGVSPDWLNGTEKQPVKQVTFTSWQDVADRLLPEVCAGTVLSAITLVRQDSSIHHIGGKMETVVFIRQLKQINRITLRVVTCSGIIPHEVVANYKTNDFLTFCETMREISRLGDIETVSVPEHIFTQFIRGNELPISLLSILRTFVEEQKDKGVNSQWGWE